MIQPIPAVNSQDHIYGNFQAPLELVEYGDYECPYCGAAYPIVKDIRQQLGQYLKFVFRNFPLSKIHPHAFSAAVATEATALQGKFWEMHDVISEHQKALGKEDILRLGETIGLMPERFKIDLQQKALAEKVERDFESGLRSDVNKTPTFFIDGEKYEGAWGNGQLLQYLKTRLEGILVV